MNRTVLGFCKIRLIEILAKVVTIRFNPPKNVRQAAWVLPSMIVLPEYGRLVDARFDSSEEQTP